LAVTKFGIAPPDFWAMPPRHFWWLVETLDPPGTGRGLSEADRRDIAEALKGNPKGEFW